VGLARLLSFDPWRAELAPVLVAVMVSAIVYNQVLATLTAFALSLIVTVSTGADIGLFTTMMSVCATAAILLPSVPSRSTLVVVGIWSAIVCFLIYWGTAVVGSRTGVVDSPTGLALWQTPAEWYQSLICSGWCVAAGFLVSGSLPFIEAAFGAVTDISLLELGDVSHPLLQELVRRAPGTYNHSITVASIGETAADAIGANGLLVRVGAYFHDIGKMLKPHYFVENTTAGENRHEHLAPAMSTLIIIGHVKDGADLSRQHNLPQPVIDFVEQHHGTTLVEYFYHEAARQAEEQPDHRTDAEESHFRYPGPKPQTREAAVLMIADAVEGASRTLSEPTPSRIERLVHDIALKRLLDGQFDESGLTMTELSRIEESLTKSLTAMYHGRVKYPEQRTA
jgi:putative nucleotidyltransferase with HDIG domain